MTPKPGQRPRILHFASGGFSGATSVAIDLVRGALTCAQHEALLVLRSKRHTPLPRVQTLRAEGLGVQLVPGWSRLASVLALTRLCHQWRPDLVVAHGFPEHLIGRHAALLAGVPHRIQVEHNTRERYGWSELGQTRWLAGRTDRIVGCSDGVQQALLAQGLPAERIQSIPNGIRLEPFALADKHPYEGRSTSLIMCARFSGQKDHSTLIRALALLKQQGLQPPLLLAGGGSDKHRRSAEALCAELGVSDQVRFLGFQADIPGMLMGQKIAVLSSHYEGMPLSLVEAMAAGCAVVGSDVPGIRELIHDEVDGRLIQAGNPQALAQALQELLQDTAQASRLAANGRTKAFNEHSLTLMTSRYFRLFDQLIFGHIEGR